MSSASDDAYERAKARRKASKNKVKFSIYDEETTVEAYRQAQKTEDVTSQKLEPVQPPPKAEVSPLALKGPTTGAKASPTPDMGLSKIEAIKGLADKLVTMEIQTSNELVTETSNGSETQDGLISSDEDNLTSNKSKDVIDNGDSNDSNTSNKLVTDSACSSDKTDNDSDTSNNPVTELVIETSNDIVGKTSNNEFNQAGDEKKDIDSKTSNELVTSSSSSTSSTEYVDKTNNTTALPLSKTSNSSSSKTNNKNVPNLDISFQKLSGLKHKLVLHIFDLCFKNINLTGGRDTGPVTKSELEEVTGANANVIHVTLSRLLKEGVIIRVGAKEGRGGYSIFSLPNNIYEEILYKPQRTFEKRTNNKQVTKLLTKAVTNSSRKIDMGFDDSQGEQKNLTISNPEWFMSLDFSGMPKSFMPTLLNKAIMIQAERKFDRKTLQNFIDRFPQFMAASTKPIDTPVGFFYSTLKDYIANGWTPVSSHLTNQELEAKALWAEERIKIVQKQELIAKARLIEEALDKETSFRTLKKEFEKWYETASEEDKHLLKAKNAFNAVNEAYYKEALLAAYMEKHGS